jgi:hypothetical protein
MLAAIGRGEAGLSIQSCASSLTQAHNPAQNREPFHDLPLPVLRRSTSLPITGADEIDAPASVLT